MAILNLEDQLCFYRAYHFNSVNVLIHTIFVPTILLTSIAFFTSVSFDSISPYLSVGSVQAAVFGAFYVLLDPLGYVVLPALVYSSYYFKNLSMEYGAGQVNKISVVLFVISWIAQFLGHGIFEKRAPALFDNLVQAFVLAPYFVCFEVLFFLGFRADLKKRVDVRVEKILAERRKKNE